MERNGSPSLHRYKALRVRQDSSIAGDVGETLGDPIDLVSRLQQDAHRVPSSRQELIPSPIWDGSAKRSLAATNQPVFHIQ